MAVAWMTGKRARRRVFLLMCLGVIAAVSLATTMATEKNRSRDFVTNLGLRLAYSRLHSNVNKTNTTGQEQERQSEEKLSQNTKRKKAILLSPQDQSQETEADQSITTKEESMFFSPHEQREGEGARNGNVSQSVSKNVTFLVAQEHPSSISTPKEPEEREQMVGGHINVSGTQNGTHLMTTSLDSPIIQDLLKRLVAVTAYSSNHFEEGKATIASIQKYLPQTKILLYDIGLTAQQRSIASTYCNVEVRTFQWDKYPKHMRNLRTYAWKPLIVQEVSQEYDVIMYGDSSLRVISPRIEKALACLLEFPFRDASPLSYYTIISFTPNQTIDYLNFPPSRQHMAKWGTLQAGCWLMLANDIMKQKVIRPWVDCALHPECIAPAGASVTGCHFTDLKYSDGRYIGCHRFDQSALNIILAREFGLELYTRLAYRKIPSELWIVQKSPSNEIPVRSCT